VTPRERAMKVGCIPCDAANFLRGTPDEVCSHVLEIEHAIAEAEVATRRAAFEEAAKKAAIEADAADAASRRAAHSGDDRAEAIFNAQERTLRRLAADLRALAGEEAAR
jgi:predicted  nucleic acid-binding Zn-ribbon protein